MSITQFGEEHDSDWEYEYDTAQTETFYVTLDLSSHVPYEAHESRAKLSTTTPTPGPQSSGNSTTDNASTQDDPKRRLQMLDISREKPLLSWNKQLFTCSWATALGTDLHFAVHRPEATAQPLDANSVAGAPNEQPLDTLTPNVPASSNTTSSYTLLPPTSLRLIAKPANVTPLPDAAPIVPPNLSNHSNFLTRLSALKSSLGETDTVPLLPPKLDFSNTTIPTPSLLLQQEEPKPKSRPTATPRRAPQSASKRKDAPAYKDDATFEDVLKPLPSSANPKRRHRKTNTEKAQILAAVEAGERVDPVGEPRQLMDEPKSMSQMMTGSRGRGRLRAGRRGKERGRRNRWGTGDRGGGDVMALDDVDGSFTVASTPRGGGVGWGGSSLNRHAVGPRMIAPAPVVSAARDVQRQYQPLAPVPGSGMHMSPMPSGAMQASQSLSSMHVSAQTMHGIAPAPQSTSMTSFQVQGTPAAVQPPQTMQPLASPAQSKQDSPATAPSLSTTMLPVEALRVPSSAQIEQIPPSGTQSTQNVSTATSDSADG